ncbi:MAG: 30S ribosomal protein S1, partial [Streptococcus salivarius]|nr:30S ribosomal protein S1 [Streptococcus salivarius]
VVIEGTGIEGVLTRRELTNDRDANVADLVKVGETLEVLVLRQVVGKDTDTVTYLVSKKRLEARKAWDKLVGREEEVVTVKGTRAVKGGLSVEFEGLRGFIPASMIDTRFVRNTEQFVGQEFDAKIKEVDPAENRFILSRREVVEAEAAEARKEVFSKLEVGSIVTGKVARLTSFGAFIDLGGVDGLVHVTELSHERNVSPKSVVSVGDEVEVKVLAIDEEAGRVSLSLKATTPGPWDGVEQKLAAGDVIEGKVKRLTDFGAFVEVLPGIDGLVHISQISHKRVENPKDVLSVGQDVTVKVLEVNADAERVSLSIKALEERPANAEGENNEKRQSRPRRPKRQEKRDYELPETQSGFSMADLFGDIEL